MFHFVRKNAVQIFPLQPRTPEFADQLFCRVGTGELFHLGVQFLVQAKAEPGNLGVLQLCPTIQSTWSNIRRAHAGKLANPTQLRSQRT